MARAGPALVFRDGEQLYGFRGLPAYKEKFATQWEPRYIAGPRELARLQILRDLSKLIARPPMEHRDEIPPDAAACVPRVSTLPALNQLCAFYGRRHAAVRAW